MNKIDNINKIDNFDKLIQNDVEKKYDKYKQIKKKSFIQYCFPDKYELLNQQLFLPEYIKKNQHNILLYHKIGSGKTCTLINIAEKFKNDKKIYIVIPASLYNNWIYELYSLCTGNTYITNKNRELLNKLNSNSIEYKNIYEETINKIHKIYNIYSYHMFVKNLPKLNLNNSLIIFDEIHNIINENQKGSFYNKINNKLQKTKNKLIIASTATPMYNSILELPILINLLKNENEDKLPINKNFTNLFLKNNKLINEDKLINMLDGYISYYEGAPEFTFPQKIIKILKCKMSDFQYNSYKTVQKESMNQDYDTLFDLPNNFFINSRMTLNMAFPNKKKGFDGYKSITKKILNKLDTFSSKYYTLFKKLKKKGNCFIYSNFLEYGGIYTIQLLLDYLGYNNFSIQGSGKKTYAIFSGDETSEYKNMIKETFNHYDNNDGKNIKIIIGSPSMREGISLLRVRYIHIIDPYWNWSRMDQIIGRGVRYCSHKDMPKKERNVKIYIYIARGSNNEKTIDDYILELANEKQKIINQFQNTLITSAIDYKLY